MREIRADYDAKTIVVYQAYSPAIAGPALRAGRFVAPFSFTRMTWIKPSFLWLMHRSDWARKAGQERILGVRVSREGWEAALGEAVLINAPGYNDVTDAPVHAQWDPERNLRGAALNHYSIQIGIGRARIETYVRDWIVGLTDLTETAQKAAKLMRAGHADRAKKLLPPERAYPVPDAIAERLAMRD
ncbi:hypothetical protein Afil01_23900 [Actinorhabdospora filicis]|uniref:DUF4291 domain-containing protein n=1 Tax=Actinorhabdospora filicis TaxID=1785913 RepID=A0A9W6SJV7_9ACTN|nr:DUF4291 domain-containing protein [Actinorhabdospora filicis]GLZ77583.1 hypothetical protein Afil01_23900 [Actinorhabdospora filicis]